MDKINQFECENFHKILHKEKNISITTKNLKFSSFDYLSTIELKFKLYSKALVFSLFIFVNYFVMNKKIFFIKIHIISKY